MRIVMLLMALAAVPSNAPRLANAADAVPKFDIARNCKGETAIASGVEETMASCVRAEEQAKNELAGQWGRFARDDKAACIGATSLDGTPSYVELQTCLEMYADNRARLGGK